MRSKVIVRVLGLQELKGTRLGVVADALQAHLVSRRLSFATTETTLRTACHFARWLAHGDRGTPRAVTRDLLRSFWSKHLPQCRCPGRPKLVLIPVRAAIGNLASVLRAAGMLDAVPTLAGAVGREVDLFERHLAMVCGCAASTIHQRRKAIGEFLGEVFPDGRVVRRSISQEAVVRFVTSRAPRYRPTSIGGLCTSLRSYFRFLRLEGVDRAQQLAHAVPSVARWSLDTVPTHLSEEELRRVWASFSRTTPRGRRDYAMTLLMSVLGLRAHEVASLQLADIDWRNGALHVPPTKTRRGRDLPIPALVAVSIARYLKSGRPSSSSRRLFLRIGVCEGEPVDSSKVRASVRQAYQRAGMPASYTGTHRLRHTAATRLVRGGAGVKEVADVLGHVSLDSTAIYAKVDLPRLRAVARPWPRRSR